MSFFILVPRIVFLDTRIILQSVTVIIQLMTKCIYSQGAFLVLHVEFQLILRGSAIPQLRTYGEGYSTRISRKARESYLILATVETSLELLLAVSQISDLVEQRSLRLVVNQLGSFSCLPMIEALLDDVQGTLDVLNRLLQNAATVLKTLALVDELLELRSYLVSPEGHVAYSLAESSTGIVLGILNLLLGRSTTTISRLKTADYKGTISATLLDEQKDMIHRLIYQSH